MASMPKEEAGSIWSQIKRLLYLGIGDVVFVTT